MSHRLLPAVAVSVLLLALPALAVPAAAQTSRRVTGAAMAVAGVLTVFQNFDCRVTGQLGSATVPYGGVIPMIPPGEVVHTGVNLNRSCDAADADGRLQFDVHNDFTDRTRSYQGSTWSPSFPHHEVMGTAKAGRNTAAIASGVALAGIGALLAFLPGGDAIEPNIDVTRREVRFVRSVSW